MNQLNNNLMDLFIRPEVRRTSEVLFHHDTAPGLRFLAIDQTKYPDSPIYIAVRRANNVPETQPEYIDRHQHTVDSLYMFMGDDEGMKGLHAVVRLADEERKIESPMTVFIPKGVAHSYRLTKGSGTYISILLTGNYNASTLEAEQ
jgi:2-isopropylmalate synthase